MPLSRRSFLAASGAVVAADVATADVVAASSALPTPASCGIDHVIVLML